MRRRLIKCTRCGLDMVSERDRLPELLREIASYAYAQREMLCEPELERGRVQTHAISIAVHVAEALRIAERCCHECATPAERLGARAPLPQASPPASCPKCGARARPAQRLPVGSFSCPACGCVFRNATA